MSERMNDTLTVVRPAPRHLKFSEPFWEGTRQKKVMLQYCRATGQYQFYPRPVSVFTGRRDIEWREVSGRGKIFSFTIARVARPPFAEHTPYVIATVQLDEGVNIVTNIVWCPLNRLEIGLRVRPSWVPLPDGTNLLLFTPEESAGEQGKGSGGLHS